MSNQLKKEWFQLITKFSSNQSLINSFWNEIENQYTLKIRHYHNLSHIMTMFNHAETIKSNITDYDTFLLAIWYHDIIYKPTKNNNEEKSALLAKKRLKSLNFDEKTIKIIQNLIISTKKHELILTENNDNSYLLDIDLSILGSEWNTYKTYIKNIRKEYAIFPDFIYKKGRKKVLQHFLERKNLYFTEFFKNKFEEQARENLLKEIESL
ncbi:HD domain-containing protein [Thalassobellus sediminis]|uniref:HD domain-containing protein n=1 Tax=Thalassobellus sediminis TaxID=3367753 RepID=UPI00378C64E6